MLTRKLSRTFRMLRRDHAPADEEISLVEDDRLARGHRALGLVEEYLDARTPGARHRADRGRGRDMAVADLGGDRQRRGERRNGDQIDLLGPEPVGLDLAGSAHNEGIAPRIERGDVERPRPGQPEASALAHRVVDEALMLSEHAALRIDDGPRTKRAGNAIAQESAVVIV